MFIVNQNFEHDHIVVLNGPKKIQQNVTLLLRSVKKKCSTFC